jgi:hypothetical protein
MNQCFSTKGLEVTVIEEPYAEIGIPDVLIVLWDKASCDWHPGRSNLTKADIKLIHYISSFRRTGVAINQIGRDLAIGSTQLRARMRRLESAGLLVIRKPDNNVRVKNFERTFFIRKIISVEAKISDWRSALNQAHRNQNFASHSYVLMPEKGDRRSKLITEASRDIGLMTLSGNMLTVKKKAKGLELPGSYFSWMLNEYVGRKFLNQAVSSDPSSKHILQ